MEVYTDSKEAVAAFIRHADVGRPVKMTSLHRVRRQELQKVPFEKKDDAVAALRRTSLREQGVDRLSQQKRSHQKQNNRILPRMQHLPPPNAVAVTAEGTVAKAPAAVWFYYVSLSILIIVLLVVALLFCCWSSSGCHPKNLEELEMLWLSLQRMPPSFTFLPSLLPSFLPSFIHSFLHSFLPSFIHSFLPSFIPSFIPSFLPSFIPSFIPSFHASFWIYFSWCKLFLMQNYFLFDAKRVFFGASPP